MSTQIVRNRNRRPSEIVENLEDVTVIWVDSNIDDSPDNLHTQSLLDDLSNCVLLYTDPELCMDYIQAITKERLFVIVSGILLQSVLPGLHSISAVTAIFIFCLDRISDRTVLGKYTKIIGIFTDQVSLLQSIRKTVNFVVKQTLAFTLLDLQTQKTARDVSKDLGSFTWFQVLVDILRKIPQTDQAKRDMLDKCKEYYAFNRIEMKRIKEFEDTYTEHKAIEWYTRDTFVYRLVNKALRTEDVELLYLFRYYVIHLCSQLESEWKRSYYGKTQILTLYRGQRMSIEEFDKLNKTIGILISTNGFFSTTRDIEVALGFITSYTDEQKTVLFEIKADRRLENVVFANIDNYSQVEGEQEVLFGLGSVFKIDDVNFDSKLCCCKIRMTATDEGSANIQDYLNAKRRQTEDFSPTVLFGRLLLLELGQIDKAERYFRMLLKNLPPDHEDFASVCNNLGNVFYGKNQLNLAFYCFARAFKIRRKTLHPQHPKIAASLLNIACVLHLKGHHQNALNCFQTAINILDQNYHDDRQMKAIAINGIGLIYRDKKEYKTALQYFNRTLQIYKRLLPENHPDIASCLGNIGLVYEDLLDYKQTLIYYFRAFEIDEEILPCAHANLIDDFNRIIDIYQKQHKYEYALKLCHKTLIKQNKNISQNNLLVAHILKNMGDMTQSINESLHYYQRALIIFERSLNPTDWLIICCLTDISRLYWRDGMFNDALKYQLKVLEKQQKVLNAEHPELVVSLENTGRIYYNLQKWKDAVSYFQKVVNILGLSIETNRSKIEEIQSLIAFSERRVGEHSRERDEATKNATTDVNKSNTQLNAREDMSVIIANPDLPGVTLSCLPEDKKTVCLDRKKKRCSILWNSKSWQCGWSFDIVHESELAMFCWEREGRAGTWWCFRRHECKGINKKKV